MATTREIILQIVQKAREDKEFFHTLVFDPEKALASLEGVDEATKKRLRAIRPGSFLVAPLVGAVKLEECDPTCSLSCDSTCGSVSCNVTCGPYNLSCKDTCGVSCGQTLEVAMR